MNRHVNIKPNLSQTYTSRNTLLSNQNKEGLSDKNEKASVNPVIPSAKDMKINKRECRVANYKAVIVSFTNPIYININSLLSFNVIFIYYLYNNWIKHEEECKKENSQSESKFKLSFKSIFIRSNTVY